MRLRFAVIALLVATFLIAATHRRAVVPGPLQLDSRRSFAVTDQAILDGFSFERVMNTLVERSGARNVTALSLFQQWFDTQNPKPGLAAANAPHCDDFFNSDGWTSFNGFARRCPTPEGSLAKAQPFVPPRFIPLALINRFDLTPVDGSNCGQYRIIYAQAAAPSPFDRLHMIFEAVFPNPEPEKGLAGCRPVAQFWATLSSINSMAERRAQLDQFFFNGLAGLPPVIHPDHYSAASGGGVRTLHYSLAAALPRFYQFRLEQRCSGYECQLIMEPDVLENMPLGSLFDGHDTSARARRFRDEFVRQVPTLAIRDVNRFFMNISREFLIPESESPDGKIANVYIVPFGLGLVTEEGRTFQARIETELRRINSPLSAFDIMVRAETQNCVWCHAGGRPLGDNLQFPRSSGILDHLSEFSREPGEAGERFAISPAMRDVFIPHRMQILRTFLASGKFPIYFDGNNAEQRTIGGGRSVQ